MNSYVIFKKVSLHKEYECVFYNISVIYIAIFFSISIPCYSCLNTFSWISCINSIFIFKFSANNCIISNYTVIRYTSIL